MGIQEERRSAILAAAAAIFAERGFHGARTADVAKRAAISKRDLYAAFPSKEDLLAGLIAEGTTTMTAPLALAKPQTRAAFYAALEAFGHEFLAKQLSLPRLTLLRLMIARAAENPDRAGDPDAAVRESVWTALAAFFAAAVEAGLVRFMPPPGDAAGAFLCILQGDAVMRALLDPAFRASSAECTARVSEALGTVMLFEARGETAPGET
jgi:AcrR family transcriptional regulator